MIKHKQTAQVTNSVFKKGGLNEYTIDKNVESKFLDANHSHFLLVDNGSQTFGGEIDFRANLEKEIARAASQNEYRPANE